ncbi:hypothetical protein [Kangiella sp.]|uniref:hypothetical protein n=1 Tax=Kangiella sp. TaxID=1920245 RepID=UPI00198C7FFC|nr:hypothetical protein [Kangiella sp.]MBD3653530.1 hypothetical protein [Kangiella sp.]
MNKASLGNVTVTVDSEKTKEIYSLITNGSAVDCGCSYCRNFLAQAPNCFPQDVLNFFEQCGIDPIKDAEVYEMGPVPLDNELHLYCGEYYFICESEPDDVADKLPNGFEFTITAPSSLEPEEFRNIKGSMCFSFMYPIPWVLSEKP